MGAQFAPFPVDQYSTADYSEVVGMEIEGPDIDTVGTTVTVNSNAKRRYKLVKNVSGGALNCGRALKYVAANYGVQVQLSADAAAVRGFTPYTMFGAKTTTIPNLAYFFMITDGPTKVLTDGDAITELDLVIASATAGAIETDEQAPTANVGVRCGTCTVAAAAKGTGADVYAQIMARCSQVA